MNKDCRQLGQHFSKQAGEVVKQQDIKPDNLADSLLGDMPKKDIVRMFFEHSKDVNFSQMEKQDVVFLVDGSASMTYGDKAPIHTVLPVAQAFTEHVRKLKNVRVSTFLYGDRKPVSVDLSNQNDVDKTAKGLNTGTDLAPTIDGLDADLPKGKGARPVHLFLLSDGDLADKEKASTAMKQLIAKRPNLSVNVCVLTTAAENTAIVQMYRSLLKDMGTQLGVIAVPMRDVAQMARSFSERIEYASRIAEIKKSKNFEPKQ